MSLIDTENGETAESFPVHGTAGLFIFVKERAAVLIHHDSIAVQRLVTAAIKFSGKKSGFMAKRVCAVIDDQVVIIFF